MFMKGFESTATSQEFKFLVNFAEKSCLIREAPLRGNQNPVQEKYQSGTKVDYFCNKNHKLEGSPFAICIGNEEWSHPVPTCKGMNVFAFLKLLAGLLSGWCIW